MGRRPIDLTGQTFGRLLVIERAPKPDHVRSTTHTVYWLCVCDCGNLLITNSQGLRNGLTKSCGCYKKELILGKTGCIKSNES